MSLVPNAKPQKTSKIYIHVYILDKRKYTS